MNKSMTRNAKAKAAATLAGAMFVAVVLGAGQPALAPPLANGQVVIVHVNSQWWIDVPNNARRLVIQLTGGWGNANIYARRVPPVGPPTVWSTQPGNNERIDVPNPQAGRWRIWVVGVGAFGNASLDARFWLRPSLTGVAVRAAPSIINGITRALADRRRDDDEDDEDDERPRGRRAVVRPVPIETLHSGRWVTGLGGVGDCRACYRIVVPRNAPALTVVTRGGRGNCVLLVRRRKLPMGARYDRYSGGEGTAQRIVIQRPVSGVYYIRLVGDPEFHGVSLRADFERAVAPAENAQAAGLLDGVQETGLDGAARSRRYFRIRFPRGAPTMVFTTRGGRGSCGLFVRRNSLPTAQEYDHRSVADGTEQTIRLRRALPGTYYVMLATRRGYRDVTLLVRTAGTGPAGPIAILTPSGREPVAVGRAHRVTWRAGDVRAVNIEVSWNAGRNWQRLASLPAETPGFLWYVPPDQAFRRDGVLLRISETGNPANRATLRLTFFRP